MNWFKNDVTIAVIVCLLLGTATFVPAIWLHQQISIQEKQQKQTRVYPPAE